MSRVVIVAAAIVSGHPPRVLAAQRSYPHELAGYWELPGGKVELGETPSAALEREIREELGCAITVTGWLDGAVEIGPGLRLRAALATLAAGEPVPREHDVIRWLDADRLEAVAWLPADVPFVAKLRASLG